jgi:low affinity Fe/Cu permease
MDKQLKVLKVAGTHRDIGNAIGESFRNDIKNFIEKRRSKIENYYDLVRKCNMYFDLTQKSFPKLIEETIAISEASNVDVLEYFFINCVEVFDLEEQEDLKHRDISVDHCTIAIAPGENGNTIVGHNEDWSLEAKDNIYILHAKIGDIEFKGLNYKTSIAGVSASFNNYGLIQCINDIYQLPTVGIPKSYVARAVLESKTLDEAQKIIINSSKASGFNHVLIQNNQVRDIELLANEYSIENRINTTYVHTNHYLSETLKSKEKFHTTSSIHRYNKAISLIQDVKDVQDMKTLLSDTSDEKFPICRRDETIGSVIIDIKNDIFLVSNGHPCSNKYLPY